ncbi:hypothetical protein RE628_11415 [Paenibacillus sp. D2_2]|uniref:hypothetical protein n=1 Tax=Paenibacillus sp. D2_2 TaxID=3073092 RepID=UPI0028158C67|nr:hypothetical protein [Paenibacillus sp. D2_2]WMT42836.1 hypothetical protein RE628_11415 [Paenibacillus sp. D2_2]
MQKHQTWTDEELKRLSELKGTGTHAEIAEKLSHEFNTTISSEGVRKRLKRGCKVAQAPLNYKNTKEILPNGSHRSDRLIEMSEEMEKDPSYLLRAHGYDPEMWELTATTWSEWGQHNRQDGTVTLYASKITIKPKQIGSNLDGLIKAIENIDPILFTYEQVETEDKRMLEIPIFDSHFGISDYEYYKQTQQKIIERLSSRHWERVLFILGQDMLHNDGFRGTTTSGTIIEQVDTAKAWEEARKFFEPLIELALSQYSVVDIIYSPGNHDEALGWAFVQMIKARYPQLNIDDRMEQRKAYVYGDNFIGITHGDKGRKDLHNIFPIEFPQEWAGAKSREIHTGHLHVEETKDVFGMAVRTLATRNRTDKWHRDNGYVGAHKRFMLFEYSEKELESIHYV